MKQKVTQKKQNVSADQLFMNPFIDFAFKKIFTSQANKEVIKAFLNEVLAGKRQIATITYTEKEYSGGVKDETDGTLDFFCTDVEGKAFQIGLQIPKQEGFEQSSLLYACRLISEQAPKDIEKWNFNLQEVYVISLLDNFCLSDNDDSSYLHNFALCYDTGEIFYDKLHFINIELMKFTKIKADLSSNLDQWFYALKHVSEMKEEPQFLKAPGLADFFNLVKYANLTKEEVNMHREE